MAIAQQRHGKVGVFGDGIDVEGTGCAHCGDTPGANCSGNDADCTESIESTALEVLAGDVFEGLPARPEIDAVANFGVAGNGAYFGIQEMRHHASDGVGSNDGIGIDADKEFSIADVIETVVEGLGFAAVGLGEDRGLCRWLVRARNARRTTSRVRSLEPSSMTMMRRLG